MRQNERQVRELLSSIEPDRRSLSFSFPCSRRPVQLRELAPSIAPAKLSLSLAHLCPRTLGRPIGQERRLS